MNYNLNLTWPNDSTGGITTIWPNWVPYYDPNYDPNIIYKPWRWDPWQNPSPWKKVSRKPKSKGRAPVKRKKTIRARSGRKETYITLILDRSGSMGSCYAQALDAINEQIDTIKENAHKGGKTFVSLVLFNHEVEVVFENVSAKELRHLTEDEYRLSGTTALRDGVMTGIDLMEEYEDDRKNQGFLVVLISDGQENSSGTTREQLQARIEELNALDTWTFTYMLDGHTWEQVQEWSIQYSTPIGNMCTYTSSPVGTEQAGLMVCNAVSNYMNDRDSGKTKSETFYNSGDGTESKAS